MTPKEIIFDYLSTLGLEGKQNFPFWIWESNKKSDVSFLHSSGEKWKGNIKIIFLEMHRRFPIERGEHVTIILTANVDKQDNVVFRGYINTIEDLNKILFLTTITISPITLENTQ